jgi:KDO2-lipid IV(A) lauroyltransferase
MRGVLANLILRALALLPLRAAHGIGSLLGALFWHGRSGLRRVTEINLARCMPELPHAERQRLARATLRETGKAMAEIGPLWCWPLDRALRLVHGVSGEEAIRAALDAGRGVVLAAPHLGCWEIIGLYMGARYPMSILYRPPRFADIERIMVSARERGGARLAPTSPAGVRQIYQTLARHGVVGILPDQDPAEGGGVFAPFFGLPANTMTLIPRLASKTGAALFIAYARRLPRGLGYEINFVPATIESGDDVAAAGALNAAIERAIRTMPEQYQWGYRRFKTRPPGAERFY